MSDINKVLSALDKPKQLKRDQWQCCCPSHDDKKQSLTVTHLPSEDKILIHCHAGCSIEDILDRANLSMADINPQKEERQLQWWEKDLEAEYRYYDSKGSYLYSKLRYKDKDMRFARISGTKYEAGRGEITETLFKLPELLKSIRQGFTVYVCEGEKDVETLKRIGLTATTSGSATSWQRRFGKHFTGASVVILNDNDESGREYAHEIEKSIRDFAFQYKVVTTSKRPKGDVSDYILDEGHTREDLLQLVDSIDWNYASWVYLDKGKDPKVNADLLANVILKNSDSFIARKMGSNADLVYWYTAGVYRKLTDIELMSKIRKYIPIGRANPTQLQNVAKMFRYGCQVRSHSEINADEHYINVRNGLYNIRTHEMEVHRPDVISEVQLNCRNLQDYNEPEHWVKFINDLCTDEEGRLDAEMVSALQEWTGLFLSQIHGYRLKRSLVLRSLEGNTGKTVYLRVITHLIGLDNIANISFQDMGENRFAISRAFGKRLIAIGDSGSNAIRDSSNFKMLTGGDCLKCEFKGKDSFDFIYTGMIVMACNSMPVFEDDKGNQLADRLMILDCRNVIPAEKRDSNLYDKLIKERDSIFAWSMEGLKRFMDNGWRFTRCRSSEKLMEEYRSKYDTLFAFVTDELVMTGNTSDFMRKTDFETRYFAYCEEHDLKPLNKKNIQDRAISIGLKAATKDGYPVYRKVRPKTINDYAVIPSEPETSEDIPF